MSSVGRATILITSWSYTRLACLRGGGSIMSGAKVAQIVDSYTAGSYSILTPAREDLTSDQKAPIEYQLDGTDELKKSLNLGRISTESGKRVCLEETLVNLVTAIMPDVECILVEGQLDLIKKRSEEIGAINAHLDTINMLLANIDETLEGQFKKFDSMKARF